MSGDFPVTAGSALWTAAVDPPQQVSGRAADAGRKPMIIEMFALPGAGKTTIANAVLEDSAGLSRAHLAKAWHRLPGHRRALFLMQAMMDVRCLRQAALFAFATRLSGWDTLRRLLRLIAKTDWMRSQAEDMLLDEGYLQEIWSICVSAGASTPDHATLTRLIRCLYVGLDAQIIFLEAHENVSAYRISSRSRGFSRFDGLVSEEIEARLIRHRELHEKIVAAVMAAGLQVDRFDALEPVEANVERLREVAKMYGNAPNQP